MSYRVMIIVLALVFAVALAGQVADRLTPQTIDVGIGVLCGLVASVPVSFGLLLAVQRRRQANEVIEEEPPWRGEPAPVTRELPYNPYANNNPYQKQPFPQIIVVSPPQGQGYPNVYPGYPNYMRPPLNAGPEEGMQERNWKIVGDEED